MVRRASHPTIFGRDSAPMVPGASSQRLHNHLLYNEKYQCENRRGQQEGQQAIFLQMEAKI
jgi:hypothetical protein